MVALTAYLLPAYVYDTPGSLIGYLGGLIHTCIYTWHAEGAPILIKQHLLLAAKNTLYN